MPWVLCIVPLVLLVVGGAPAAAATGSEATAGAATRWSWPLDGVPPVTRGFDPPDTAYGRGHRGVDLASTAGAVVRAAGAGVVSYAGLLAGRGVVTVVHGSLRTTYEPVTATVGVGRRVVRGEPIGVLAAGHAGCPAAACLHWGLLRGDVYLDPLTLVGRGPVRLLPHVAPLAGRGGARAGPGGGTAVLAAELAPASPASAPTARAAARPGDRPGASAPAMALGALALAGLTAAMIGRVGPARAVDRAGPAP